MLFLNTIVLQNFLILLHTATVNLNHVNKQNKNVIFIIFLVNIFEYQQILYDCLIFLEVHNMRSNKAQNSS